MSFEDRFREMLNAKASKIDTGTEMPSTIKPRYRRRLAIQLLAGVASVALVGVAVAGGLRYFNSDGRQDRDVASRLVPPGKVVSHVGLWKGTSETSVEGHRVLIELRVRPGETPDDPPTAILVNTGDQPIGYGYPYTLHRLVGDSWAEVDNSLAFILPELTVEPGERSKPDDILFARKLQGPLRPGRPGEYRITKWVQPSKAGPWKSGSRPPSFKVAARFVIED